MQDEEVVVGGNLKNNNNNNKSYLTTKVWNCCLKAFISFNSKSSRDKAKKEG